MAKLLVIAFVRQRQFQASATGTHRLSANDDNLSLNNAAEPQRQVLKNAISMKA